MTFVIPPQTPINRVLSIVPAVLAVVVLGVFLFVLGPQWGLTFRPHAPDWGLLAQQTPVLQLHIASATLALVIGAVLLAGVKGNTVHRTLGWTWAVAMATTAITSLFIRELNDGVFSWIHLFSGWTIIVLPMALYAARRHEVAKHRGRMTGLFVGALLIAGMFTFFPGRLMWRVFLG